MTRWSFRARTWLFERTPPRPLQQPVVPSLPRPPRPTGPVTTGRCLLRSLAVVGGSSGARCCVAGVGRGGSAQDESLQGVGGATHPNRRRRVSPAGGGGARVRLAATWLGRVSSGVDRVHARGRASYGRWYPMPSRHGVTPPAAARAAARTTAPDRGAVTCNWPATWRARRRAMGLGILELRSTAPVPPAWLRPRGRRGGRRLSPRLEDQGPRARRAPQAPAAARAAAAHRLRRAASTCSRWATRAWTRAATCKTGQVLLGAVPVLGDRASITVWRRAARNAAQLGDRVRDYPERGGTGHPGCRAASVIASSSRVVTAAAPAAANAHPDSCSPTGRARSAATRTPRTAVARLHTAAPFAVAGRGRPGVVRGPGSDCPRRSRPRGRRPVVAPGPERRSPRPRRRRPRSPSRRPTLPR